MSEKIPPGKMFGIALLVTGNLVGAGILALPINTGLAGLIPSLVVMLIFGICMFFTAVVLGVEANESKEETFNYPSLYRMYLGPAGKWVAVLANMLILYGLLTAYLSGGTTIIKHLFDVPDAYDWVPLLILFLSTTTLALTEVSFIRKYNTALMLMLWISFAIIVIMGEFHVKPERLLYTDWTFAPVAIPIVVTAFHFHNIIPTLCHDSGWSRQIWKPTLTGMIIGFIMNAIWIQVGVGALSLIGGKASLDYAWHNQLPATVPLSNIMHSTTFLTCAMLFAILAIITSYVANGMGLLGFMTDLTKIRGKKVSAPAGGSFDIRASADHFAGQAGRLPCVAERGRRCRHSHAFRDSPRDNCDNQAPFRGDATHFRRHAAPVPLRPGS